MVAIDFSFDPPLGLIIEDLWSLESSLSSFREPLQKAVEEVLVPSIRENFQVGGRPAWAPLSDNTVLRRSAGGYGTDPLVKTGNLRDVGTSERIWAYSDDAAYIENLGDAEYGAYHQVGFTTRNGGIVPERPWAVIQPEDEDKIDEVFMKWIDDQLDKYGWD